MNPVIVISSAPNLTTSLRLPEHETVRDANATAGYDVISYISDEVVFYFEVVVYVALCGAISIVGIATNVINIIVFVRQGVFTESTNVSLLALAVSELFCTATMLWLSISYGVYLADPPGLNWNPFEVMFLTAGYPHIMCSLITRSITAFIAFERCFCVVFPFKVKRVFTPRRSLVAVVCIFAYYFLSYSPVFILIRFRSVRDRDTNTTRVVLYQDPIWPFVEKITTIGFNLFTLNLLSGLIVLVCTSITVSRVKLSSAWKKSMVPGNGPRNNIGNNDANKIYNTKTKTDDTFGQNFDKESKEDNVVSKSNQVANVKIIDKEKKVIKMVTLICVVFLVCYSPNVIFLLMYAIDNEIRVTGKHENLAIMSSAISFLFESVNSCINIVLYYKMSSKFKKEFDILFGRDNKHC